MINLIDIYGNDNNHINDNNLYARQKKFLSSNFYYKFSINMNPNNKINLC